MNTFLHICFWLCKFSLPLSWRTKLVYTINKMFFYMQLVVAFHFFFLIQCIVELKMLITCDIISELAGTCLIIRRNTSYPKTLCQCYLFFPRLNISLIHHFFQYAWWSKVCRLFSGAFCTGVYRFLIHFSRMCGFFFWNAFNPFFRRE